MKTLIAASIVLASGVTQAQSFDYEKAVGSAELYSTLIGPAQSHGFPAIAALLPTRKSSAMSLTRRFRNSNQFNTQPSGPCG
jgi:hypothetical protein